MIKKAIEKNEKATPNGADLEVLKKHFGMCFNSDGSLDLEKLKARLGGSGGYLRKPPVKWALRGDCPQRSESCTRRQNLASHF